jgi:hypothetical protein
MYQRAKNAPPSWWGVGSSCAKAVVIMKELACFDENSGCINIRRGHGGRSAIRCHGDAW